MMVCGCDEVGRGCLAGPVVAAAVLLPENIPPDFPQALIDCKDSKLLSAKKREETAKEICLISPSWAVSEIDAVQIDATNILKASLLAMRLSIISLRLSNESILVDGPYSPMSENKNITPIVKGDSKHYAISAASIMAKVYRDHLMQRLHEFDPRFGFSRNKGYGTKEHKAALHDYGPCKYHRSSFLS